jgi:hypothetical protein
MKPFTETRKSWTKPELKKIDIDQITAAKFSPGGDGNGFS